MGLPGSGGLMLHSDILANVTVQDPSVPVFTLLTTLSVNITFGLNATAIVPTMTWNTGSTKLVWSRVGSEWSGLVSPLVTDAIQYFVLPYVNKVMLSGGFPIPSTPQLKIVKPSLHWSTESLVVAADFTLL